MDIPKDIFNEIMGAEFGSTRFHGNIRHLEGVAIPTSPDDHVNGLDKPGRFALLVITDTEMLLYEMKDGHAGTNSWGTKVKQRRKEPVQPLFQFDLTQVRPRHAPPVLSRLVPTPPVPPSLCFLFSLPFFSVPFRLVLISSLHFTSFPFPSVPFPHHIPPDQRRED